VIQYYDCVSAWKTVSYFRMIGRNRMSNHRQPQFLEGQFSRTEFPLARTNNKPQVPGRKPLAKLRPLGKLEDILESQASPEFKAACIEMGMEAAARRSKAKRQTD
jgi:hypothetical protein